MELCLTIIVVELPVGMVSNESFGHQLILLRNYGIALSQAVILIVNNFGKSLFKTMEIIHEFSFLQTNPSYETGQYMWSM